LSTKLQLPKYYPLSSDIRKQLPHLWTFIGIFIFSFILALGFKNEIVRYIMLFVSFSYPVLIVFLILSLIPRLNYYQIDSRGVYVKILGVFSKKYYWSEIEKIGPTKFMGDYKALGMMYSSSVNRYILGRKTRLKNWGWDELVSNSFTKDGASIIKDINRYFKKYGRTANK